ncbi:hypothetical protein TSAR_016245, partial [Trichomalopsis sarcophagae]
MIRHCRIDYSGFTMLRTEDSNNIEAVMCKICKSILRTITAKRLQNHRNSCMEFPPNDMSAELNANARNNDQNIDPSLSEATHRQHNFVRHLRNLLL